MKLFTYILDFLYFCFHCLFSQKKIKEQLDKLLFQSGDLYFVLLVGFDEKNKTNLIEKNIFFESFFQISVAKIRQKLAIFFPFTNRFSFCIAELLFERIRLMRLKIICDSDDPFLGAFKTKHKKLVEDGYKIIVITMVQSGEEGFGKEQFACQLQIEYQAENNQYVWHSGDICLFNSIKRSRIVA